MKAVLTLSKTFFKDHFRNGKETHFKGKVLYGQKKHTCRSNYDYWKDRIDKVKQRGGTLSLREWRDKPYRSKQQVIKDIPGEVVGVQKLCLSRRNVSLSKVIGLEVNTYKYTAVVDGVKVPLELIAENDGLSQNEFIDWFKPAFNRLERELKKEGKASDLINIEFAVIHFTKERY